MNVHFFQRYHPKENVATANTMLLLQRLYFYSPNKFCTFIKTLTNDNDFEFGLLIGMQEYNGKSVPDAVISQKSFKIVIETKIKDWFNEKQLENHLESFNNEEIKILVSIASEHMALEKVDKFETLLKQKSPGVRHINTTFAELADTIASTLDENKDSTFFEILSDYREYCYADDLIPTAKKADNMIVSVSKFSMEFNVKNGVYYISSANRLKKECDYIGLYGDKTIKYIAKIDALVEAMFVDGKVRYREEYNLTAEQEEKIFRAIQYALTRNSDVTKEYLSFYLVDKFYATDFKKENGWIQRSVYLDLRKALGNPKRMPPINEELAKKLSGMTWSLMRKK